MFNPVKKLFGKDSVGDIEFDRYMDIHKEMLEVDDLVTNMCLITQAGLALGSGHTIEEAIMRNLLFRTAYLASTRVGSATAMLSMYEQTLGVLETLKPWVDDGLIRPETWDHEVNAITTITRLGPESRPMIKSVLSDLYRNNPASSFG
ncbi:MAG: hypothetical protein WBN81_14105 [Gammaproteobacteria bacterium]